MRPLASPSGRRGLSRERLLAQIEDVEALTKELAPFSILTGIETDILEDGKLDQGEDLLSRLELSSARTQLAAHAARRHDAPSVEGDREPSLDILGHCTAPHNRKAGGLSPISTPEPCSMPVPVTTRRSRSTAGRSASTPPNLLRLAVEMGCKSRKYGRPYS